MNTNAYTTNIIIIIMNVRHIVPCDDERRRRLCRSYTNSNKYLSHRAVPCDDDDDNDDTIDISIITVVFFPIKISSIPSY